jgi:peroxiredoxin
MTELREFARHSDDLDKIGVRLVPISVDNQQHAREVWEKVVEKKFTILSDPGATVIKKYGLLHESGGAAHGGSDIALRTTILVGPDGSEQWRRVSQSVPDIPNWEDTLAAVKQAQERQHGMDQNR